MTDRRIDKVHVEITRKGLAHARPNNTRSMQDMFGASVSELYLLIKSLNNIEVDLCVITKKNTHAYTGTVSQTWL